ncbi:MAG: gamma-glutamylcyclotransferase family protein [Thermomicrobiales bacterium]
MAEAAVWTFFYGSFMNRTVLARQGVTLGEAEVSRLPGFAIRMQLLSNLVPDENACVYGILARLTHHELGRLYSHLPGTAGDAYHPDAVLVQTRAGDWRPALCYIAPPLEPAPAATDYLDDLLVAAQEYAFPDWYLHRLEQARDGSISRSEG